MVVQLQLNLSIEESLAPTMATHRVVVSSSSLSIFSSLSLSLVYDK